MLLRAIPFTAKLNEAIEVLMADGTIQKLIDDYVGDNATFSGYKSPDGISRTNGTLVMATNAYFKPYEYYEGVLLLVLTLILHRLLLITSE